jgi:SOS-response transcriptional repressor LexA
MPRKPERLDLPKWAKEIVKLRKRMGMNQVQFSNRLGVSQSMVSRWENGEFRPEAQDLIRIGELASNIGELPFYFFEEAGVPRGYFNGEKKWKGLLPPNELLAVALEARSEAALIPLLSEPAAAGSPREVIEKSIQSILPVPREWVPRGASLVALKVVGDSMADLILDGFIVLVDTAQQDPRKLVGRMVAARSANGVTVKWLRKDRDIFMLVPQHVSLRHQVVIVRSDEDFGLVGAVERWIGAPPPVRK